MDLKISGSGSAGGGEYDNIRLSGSSRIDGFVRCKSYHASGSSKCAELECEGDVRASGASKFEGRVKCQSFTASGASKVLGGLVCGGRASVSGAFRCDESAKCGELHASGSTHIEGDIEAEYVRISGAVHCGGLINAENVEIIFGESSDAESIGGTEITVKRDIETNVLKLFGLNISVGSHGHGTFTVRSDIEGDRVTLEYVNAACVSGREVVIGEGCDIGTVRYGESLELSENAVVGSVEKI